MRLRVLSSMAVTVLSAAIDLGNSVQTTRSSFGNRMANLGYDYFLNALPLYFNVYTCQSTKLFSR